ncbi:hypothetical protein C4D60_Mb04t30370 [Musa balbisiana]|uniref:Uncharacterized protein n=1 Tax=Musa balbisiana TaxID=52838 RepID=A0A4S8KFR5_MUSBA|nr:hypothetical protein C4D60_Mb04t30370 [Musa balbisiana]
MAFVAKKPPSSSSSDENQTMEVARSPVSNSLYLKGPDAAGGAERRSLDKDVMPYFGLVKVIYTYNSLGSDKILHYG